jgi:spore germination protein YaaH
VAPTLGKGNWGNDILDGLRGLLALVPPEKVILVVPFYGYEWQTTTLNLETAQTYPKTGATLTYERLQSLLGRKKALKLTEHWDEHSLSPYITYEEEDEFFIGFYENERSLGYKIDLARGLNLGGIAIWALGYEGETSELWQTSEKRL